MKITTNFEDILAAEWIYNNTSSAYASMLLSQAMCLACLISLSHKNAVILMFSEAISALWLLVPD